MQESQEATVAALKLDGFYVGRRSSASRDWPLHYLRQNGKRRVSEAGAAQRGVVGCCSSKLQKWQAQRIAEREKIVMA